MTSRLTEYYINEKLDLNLPIKVVANNKYTWQAQWEVDGVLFQFAADLDDEPDFNYPDDLPESWGVVFFNMSEPTRFGVGNSKLTGSMGGKSLKVFSGVASAFKKFISAKKPEEFFFTAEEPSRIRLYNRISKMISQKFPYKLKRYKEEGDSAYEFTRS